MLGSRPGSRPGSAPPEREMAAIAPRDWEDAASEARPRSARAPASEAPGAAAALTVDNAEPPPLHVSFWHWAVVHALILTVSLVRLTCVLFLLFLGASHLYLTELYGFYAEGSFKLWHPGFVSAVFFALAAVMLWPLLRHATLVVSCRSEQLYGRTGDTSTTASSSLTSSVADEAGASAAAAGTAAGDGQTAAKRRCCDLRAAWRSLSAFLRRNFSVRGRYFIELLVAAELLELSAQTLNLFDIAASGIGAGGVTSFAAILVVNAVVSPALLLIPSPTAERDASVTVDSAMDLSYGVLWPLAQMVSALQPLLACNGVVSDWGLILELLELFSQLLIQGPLELLVRLMPFLSSHVLLGELMSAIIQEQRHVLVRGVQPADVSSSLLRAERARPRRKRLRIAGVAAGVAFAAAILALISVRVTDRCQDEPLCTKQAYPLDSGECHCVVLDPGCSEADAFSGSEAGLDAAIARLAPSLRVLDLKHCALRELPPSAAELDALWMLLGEYNRFSELPATAEMDSLLIALLDGNELTAVPHFTPDGVVMLVTLGHNNVTALRADTHDLVNLRALWLESNPIQGAIPCGYGAIDVVRLTISDTNITALPPSECLTGWRRSLEWLIAGSTAITEVPLPAFDDMDVLTDVHFGSSPICADPSADLGKLVGAMEGVCDVACAANCPAFLHGDGFCHEAASCDSEVCGWDGGDCLGTIC